MDNKESLTTYVFKLSFAFPFLDLKRVLSRQEVVVPRHTVWSSEHIEIHASPTVGFANLEEKIGLTLDDLFHKSKILLLSCNTMKLYDYADKATGKFLLFPVEFPHRKISI